MIKLSIIIVNYNVRHFLDQALQSVLNATKEIETEIFVVDNNSVDQSIEMLEQKFPSVQLIKNKKNVGFSKANNQAIEQATGKYILLLNPDTIVEEDTFQKTIEFMDQHPDAGGLGVKMINGDGVFLPESKRALPTPWVAFYKVFGLSRIFPKSKKYGKYHLTYLDPNETHQVEVLSGAFMMLRKSVIDEIGLLDETFFMYGEDIDLSYRIIKAGYKNYYFPHTKIIHYKGESTKKGSLNYVLVFYNAMRIFAKKHFTPENVSFFMLLIQLAIYFRASVSIANRIFNKILFPLVEFLLILLFTLFIKWGWERFVRYPGGESYDPILTWIVSPIYALLFVLFFGAFGAYRRPYKIRSIILGVLSAFISIATISFIFKSINFSRAIVFLVSGGSLPIAFASRALSNYFRSGNLFLDEKERKRVLIVGSAKEIKRVLVLVNEKIHYLCEIIGVILQPKSNDYHSPIQNLGDLTQLDEISRFYQIEEIIFCNKDLSAQSIIDYMTHLSNRNIEFKIIPHQADYLVGPSMILHSSIYQNKIMKLQLRETRIKKKAFDLVISLILMLIYPLTFWIYKEPLKSLLNLLSVIKGDYHLVGYINGNYNDLPKLKNSLLNMNILAKKKNLIQNTDKNEVSRLDSMYANNYSIALDWEILVHGLKYIGNKKTK